MANSITPPPELVRQWMERTEYDEHTWFYESYIAEQAARWGADQELEACCAEVSFLASKLLATQVRAARRPKPPSLKKQALNALEVIPKLVGFESERDDIRQALETLPND